MRTLFSSALAPLAKSNKIGNNNELATRRKIGENQSACEAFWMASIGCPSRFFIIFLATDRHAWRPSGQLPHLRAWRHLRRAHEMRAPGFVCLNGGS
jgi:hypothetical protein